MVEKFFLAKSNATRPSLAAEDLKPLPLCLVWPQGEARKITGILGPHFQLRNFRIFATRPVWTIGTLSWVTTTKSRNTSRIVSKSKFSNWKSRNEFCFVADVFRTLPFLNGVFVSKTRRTSCLPYAGVRWYHS